MAVLSLLKYILNKFEAILQEISLFLMNGISRNFQQDLSAGFKLGVNFFVWLGFLFMRLLFDENKDSGVCFVD